MQDMEWIHMETPYVTGIPEIMGGSGDPSPVTAFGVFVGMKAAAKKVFGSDSLQGKKVLVQGVGNVGSYLVAHLVENGAEVFVADINQTRVQNIVLKHKVAAVPMDQMFDIDIDIYAPCALGATINDDSLPKLKCSIVAGGANNQLKNEKIHGQMLIDRGILYAPDFLINGGGITNVYYEHTGNYNREKVMQQTERIYDTALSVWALSEKEGITPQEGAMKIALKRINDMGKVKLAY
jgi:leucine dehydrogenase